MHNTCVIALKHPAVWHVMIGIVSVRWHVQKSSPFLIVLVLCMNQIVWWGSLRLGPVRLNLIAMPMLCIVASCDSIDNEGRNFT